MNLGYLISVFLSMFVSISAFAQVEKISSEADAKPEHYMKVISEQRDSIEKLAHSVKEKSDKLYDVTLEKERLEKKLNAEDTFVSSKQTLIGIVAISATVVAVVLLFLYNSIKEKNKLHDQLEEQFRKVRESNFELDLKNREVLDSIGYASRIQEASLPHKSDFKKLLPRSFIYYRPKDLVSGDFFWITEVGQKVYVATGDCTGHGVPGALLTIFGVTHLKQIIEGRMIRTPGLILDELRKDIISSLTVAHGGEVLNDGMDLSIYSIDKLTKRMDYACANNGIYVLRNKEITDIRPDKQPIGFSPSLEKPFRSGSFQLEKDDLIVTYTDGYPDQFGGPKGKKMKSKRFKEIIQKVSLMPESQVSANLHSHFMKWKGNLEQIDDVCVIGVRIT